MSQDEVLGMTQTVNQSFLSCVILSGGQKAGDEGSLAQDKLHELMRSMSEQRRSMTRAARGNAPLLRKWTPLDCDRRLYLLRNLIERDDVRRRLDNILDELILEV